MIRMKNRAVPEPVDAALRLLLEARQDRVRALRVPPSSRSRHDDLDDWTTVALEQLADGILFVVRKNQVLQDEVRSLRDEIRRLRARLPAA
ncbi:MAG TPA: hypothetical protein VG370_30365 [Chloroflexota bacterium]|nr:hypothetical protein [Chloroflexota bacterium]